MEANHEDRKVLLKGTLVLCKRGQCVKSLQGWAESWRCSVKVVRNFFELLKSDGMIETESVTVTTRLTVCKYESYQETGQAKGTVGAGKGRGAGTEGSYKQECKELEEEKEEERESAGAKEIEKIFRPSYAPTMEQVLVFFSTHGREDLAEPFFLKNEETAWLYRDGSPIMKWTAWAVGFIKTAQGAAERESKKEASKPTRRTSTHVMTEKDFSTVAEWLDYQSKQNGK